ncbi:MAG TPA: 2-phospho-L-lactate guanylyltransferase [Thermoproteota archaeon]|nr:2-phospho-L-lactate guanylyltransferase [Thermoproteota archaeon]
MAHFAVLPVKERSSSKTRFSSVLNQEQRAILTRSMLLDTVDSMIGSRVFEGITILTPEPEDWKQQVESLVRVVGTGVSGLNESVWEYMQSQRLSEGDSLSIVLPDLPASQTEDYIELGETLGTKGSAAIAPDRHLTGTNVLAGTYPLTWRPMFGIDSFRRHLTSLLSRGTKPRVLYREGLMCDVDEPDDLVDLINKERVGRRTREFVAGNMSQAGATRLE